MNNLLTRTDNCTPRRAVHYNEQRGARAVEDECVECKPSAALCVPLFRCARPADACAAFDQQGSKRTATGKGKIKEKD